MGTKILAAVVLLALSTTASAQPPGVPRPNLFGGYDYGGGWSSRATPGGGFTYHGPFGRQGGYSTPNAFGGFDYHRPFGRFDGYSTPNAFGGFDYHRPLGRPGGPGFQPRR